MLAKIVFVLSVGLLFTHQLIAHFHHDEISSAFHHQHSDGNDEHGLPAHSIDHVFSINTTSTDVLKIFYDESPLLSSFISLILSPGIYSPTKYHNIDIRPPVFDYYSSISLRGPPAC